jgi:hypothetical protein
MAHASDAPIAVSVAAVAVRQTRAVVVWGCIQLSPACADNGRAQLTGPISLSSTSRIHERMAQIQTTAGRARSNSRIASASRPADTYASPLRRRARSNSRIASASRPADTYASPLRVAHGEAAQATDRTGRSLTTIT